MKFLESGWKADYKAIATDMAKSGHGPSDGLVCIAASLAYIKRGLIKQDKLSKDALDKAFKELFQSVQGKDAEGKVISNAGFCCNASAAMKAAGLSTNGSVAKAMDLPD